MGLSREPALCCWRRKDDRHARLLRSSALWPGRVSRWRIRFARERVLGDVSDQYIWRFLRAHKIYLAARKSWCQTDDPDFVAKAAEIVGLYLDPPHNAIVLAVDEKPHIQALERAQGYLKLPDGRALSGRSHDYKRHGTSTLFAALASSSSTS